MTREERIVATFVELSNTMVEDYDVVEFLHTVSERCVELLDCAEAGLMLVDAGGTLRVMASSSESSEVLEVLQIQHSEGPCYECQALGEPVVSADLEAELERWPTFAPVAVKKGIRSVQALPMRVRGETVGAMNLFRADTGCLAAEDVPLGQGMADFAAIALLQGRSLRESQDVVERLQNALTSRVVIEQAKGVLAERARIGVDLAFDRLRAYARSNNRRLSDVAQDLIEGRIETSSLIATPTGGSSGH